MASEPLKHTRSGSMVQNVAGRPEPDSGPGPDLPAVWISPSNTPKVHGRVLRTNPVTISHFLYVPHYYWDVGRPGLVSDPGPDLSTNGYLLKYTKKYTGVYFELIRSLLAHFLCVPYYYRGVGRPGLVSDPGPDLPPNGYLLKYTKSTRVYTLS